MAHAYGATDGDVEDDDDASIRPRTHRRDARAMAMGAVATLAIAFFVLISTRFVGSARLGGFNFKPPKLPKPDFSSIFDQIRRRIETSLKGSSYNTATCTSQLQFHGWCETNAVIFSSGCLAQYPGVYYYKVGAPYPVPNSQVHWVFSSCVKTYYKDKIVGDYATYGLTLDDATANHLVAAMFPESSSYGDSNWVEAFEDADLNAESDFGQDDNFGADGAGATASMNVNALYKSYVASTTSCQDQYCFSFCPSDLGLKSSYSISVPKVCAKFRIVGKTYKKCISVPTVKFNLPTSCKQVCVMFPGYCSLITKAQQFTAVTQVSSIQGLLDLNVLPSSVKSSIQTAVSDAAKYLTLASTTSVQGLVNTGLLAGGVIGVINDAQSALSNIANGLEDKLRNVVSLAWGNTMSSADELHTLIENGILDALDSTSAAAALGLGRDNVALYGDIQNALHKAFRGEELELDSKAAETERAQLGASGPGSCFDLVLSALDDYEAPSYLMPWPEKLKDDPFAPGSIDIKFPKLTTSLCANIAKFKIPPQVAVKLFEAFNSMFESLFTELYSQTGLKALVDQIKDLGNGKFYGGRRLLSAEDEKLFVETHLKYKQQFAEAEISVFNQIIKFHERLTVLSLGERNAPSLGAGAFDAILEKFTDDLKEALKLMANGADVDGTFTLAFKSKTSMKVEQGITQTGEFLSDLGLENTIEKTKIFPTSLPGLVILVDLKVSVSLPYFFRAETEGDFGVAVEVAFPVDVKISKSPSVTFGTPTVTSEVLGSAEIHVGLQTGIVVQIESAYVALCAGPVCAGPELYARQDVYYGMDAFAMTLDRAKATCESEAHSLTALWNDWDYPSTTKSQCTASVAGIGGYLQVPKTELEVSMMMKPIPIQEGGDTGGGDTGGGDTGNDPGMDALLPSPALQLFDFTPLINEVYDSSGNFHTQELFSECTAPNSPAAPRDCAPTCPASFKFKSADGECLTSFEGNVLMEDCSKDGDGAEMRSHWWEIIPWNGDSAVRIRLSESFSCLTVTPRSASFRTRELELALANCDDANDAQLLEYVDNCFSLSGQDYPCLRTAAANIHNLDATGSASGRLHSKITLNGEVKLVKKMPGDSLFVIAKA